MEAIDSNLKDETNNNIASVLYQFEEYIKNTDRSRSARSYVGDVRRFLQWYYTDNNDLYWNRISPLVLVSYRDFLQVNGGKQGMGAAPATVNRALVSLRIFFSWLQETGRITVNPAKGIKPVAIAKPVPYWLSKKQQLALLGTVRQKGNTRDVCMIGLMLYAGLRVGELCSLKRENIQLNGNSGWVAVTGKGNKYREVPLCNTIRCILSRWLEENPAGPLFPNRNGNPITARGVFQIVVKYAEQSGLTGVTPHTLRHSFCKNAVDAGISIDRVALMVGHSSLDTTKRYTLPSREDLQRAVERMDRE